MCACSWISNVICYYLYKKSHIRNAVYLTMQHYIIFFLGHYKLRFCTSHCRPCEVDHPSCEGYPDGRSYHGYKKAPWYMVCEAGRFVKQRRCKFSRYGHPSCLIECGSRENRYYATEDCRSYVWCYYGRKFDYRCPPGTVFNKQQRHCEHLSDTCKPCGTKSW